MHRPHPTSIDGETAICKSVRVFVTNHVLAGVLIGRRFAGRPGTAFLVGFGSHLAMDAVPHWGCDIHQPGGQERFLRVARRDGILGLAVIAGAARTVPPERRSATAAAIAGAVLLDVDKPCLHFFSRNPVPDWIQRIHGWVQRESGRLLPVEFATGATLALLELVSSLSGRAVPRAIDRGAV